MLSLTIGLGTWQLERLAWKTDLLARIDRGEASKPIDLPAAPEPFQRYIAKGHLAQAEGRYGAEVRQTSQGPLMGVHLLGVLLRDGQAPVVVDRGWVPDQSLPAASDGQVTIEGYVRSPEHTPFMGAADDPANRRFYALDPVSIGRSLGFPGVAPFTLVAMGPAQGEPVPVQTLPRPPNDHLSYAITWFSLSAALVVIFVVYAFQALCREKPL